jgi:FixJ family two-component response regulator
MVMKSKAKTVAIVEDDDSVRNALQGVMKAVGLRAQAFASAEEFLKSGELQHTACLIADIRLPGISGLELQQRLNAEQVTIPVMLITAHGDDAVRTQALRAGAILFLTKPFDDDVLIESVRAALDS